MPDYNLFHNTITGKNGKQIKKWYYWFYDQNGKQIKRVCKGCGIKAEAEAYIELLPPLKPLKNIMIKDIAGDMFIPGGFHYERRKQLGDALEPDTIRQKRRFIDLIIATWGEIGINELTAPMVHNYLVDIDRSGSWKNAFLDTLNEIFDDSSYHGSAVIKPNFKRFKLNYKKADILTTEELNKLFVVENFPSETLFLMFLTCLSCGLRLGEARAIRPCQLIVQKKMLIIDGFLKREPIRTSYNKKGSGETPRLRIVPLPDITFGLLFDYILKSGKKDQEILFTMPDGSPVKQEYAENVFKRAVIRAEIDTNSKKIVPHSLRYTYVTRMRRELSVEDVAKIAGHNSLEMTEYYTRIALDEMADALLPKKELINRFFA